MRLEARRVLERLERGGWSGEEGGSVGRQVSCGRIDRMVRAGATARVAAGEGEC